MACHLIGGGNDGSQDMTSDYSFAAIGVPRNMEIPANADPKYFDLGLCGPLRTDHRPGKDKGAAATCGMFKTPVLRNVATRHVFMHNGVFKSLEEVVRFYNTRDTAPEKWYPRDAKGRVNKFDDLPAQYRANLDDQMPLDLRKPGSATPMTDQEMQDLIVFLKTLTDGFVPPAGTRRERSAGPHGGGSRRRACGRERRAHAQAQAHAQDAMTRYSNDPQTMKPILFATVAVLALLAGCSAPDAPNEANFRAALEKQLEAHGDLCIGRHSWPVDVPDPARGGAAARRHPDARARACRAGGAHQRRNDRCATRMARRKP